MATADLLQAMRKQAKPTAVTPSPTEDPVPDGGGETAVPPSRTGKRQVAAYFPVPVQRQLKLLTIEKDTTVQPDAETLRLGRLGSHSELGL